MATGIRKLHSAACRSRSGGRCNCGGGYEAAVYLHREGRKLRKTFRREAEAKSRGAPMRWPPRTGAPYGRHGGTREPLPTGFRSTSLG